MAKHTKATPSDDDPKQPVKRLTRAPADDSQQVIQQALKDSGTPEWTHEHLLADPRTADQIALRSRYPALVRSLVASRPQLEEAQIKNREAARAARFELPPGPGRTGRYEKCEATRELERLEAELEDARLDYEAAPAVLVRFFKKMAESLVAGRQLLEDGKAIDSEMHDAVSGLVAALKTVRQTVDKVEAFDRDAANLPGHTLASPLFCRLAAFTSQDTFDKLNFIVSTASRGMAEWDEAVEAQRLRDKGEVPPVDAAAEEKQRFARWAADHKRAVALFRGTPNGKALRKLARRADAEYEQAVRDAAPDQKTKREDARQAARRYHEAADRHVGNEIHSEIYPTGATR